MDTVVPKRKFGKIQFIVFYGLDGYFWTLITTSNTKKPKFELKNIIFLRKIDGLSIRRGHFIQ